MNSSGLSFWDHVYNLRKRGLIPRIWKVGHLRTHLQEPVGPSYSPNTVTVNPSNSSVSTDGNVIGDFVKRGAAPKAWRVGRGQYQLVADPEDDEQTRQAEVQRAADMADAIRAFRTHTARQSATQESPLAQYEAGSRPQSRELRASLYPSVEVELTPGDLQAMAALDAGKRAVHIVRMHLLDRFGPGAEIELDEEGAGLRVSAGGERLYIQIESTESPVLDWEQMKISDQRAHYALTRGEATMYRVVNISGPNPRIYILNHGQHFTLEPEPTWAVKKVVPKDEKYPLRGEPYTYDLPFDPVAADDWEVMA